MCSSSSCFMPGQVVKSFILSYALFIPKVTSIWLIMHLLKNNQFLFIRWFQFIFTIISVTFINIYSTKRICVSIAGTLFYTTSYSYSSFSRHHKSLDLGPSTLNVQVRGQWSLTMVNFLPYKWFNNFTKIGDKPLVVSC